MTLRDIKEGQSARIIRVRGSGPFRRRLMEMGFVPGETVFVQRYAPLRDPVEFIVKEYHVSLRRDDAAFVEVATQIPDHERPIPGQQPHGRGWINRWRRG
jgi:Fe2+ transport system protein FeoA